MLNCSIVILAAGASVRLGEPKQLLRYEGKSLLQHAVSEAINSEAQTVVVVTGAYPDVISGEIGESNVQLVNNPKWEQGMASSIRTGLDAILKISPLTETAIFMVCDQPHVSSSLLDDLIDSHVKTGKPIVACDYGDTIGPPALFHKSIFPELMQLEGDAGAKKIIQKHEDDVAKVSFSKGNIDIDTKQDYEALTHQS